jgi:hypothetical protein
MSLHNVPFGSHLFDIFQTNLGQLFNVMSTIRTQKAVEVNDL